MVKMHYRLPDKISFGIQIRLHVFVDLIPIFIFIFGFYFSIVVEMKAKLRYIWSFGNDDAVGMSDSGLDGSDGSDGLDAINTKNEIAHMLTRGCHTKILKSKVRKLNSLAACTL